MKRFEWKGFIVGVVVTLMLSIVVPVTAAMIQKEITVNTGVNVYVDDVKLNPKDANGNDVELFIYNGTTYLPVRAISDAFDQPIAWDGATSSVYVGEHISDEPQAYLYQLDYYDANRPFSYETEIQDNFGNYHSHGIIENTGVWTGNSDSWEEYILNGTYTRLTGNVVLKYFYRTTDYDYNVKIYGDDKLLFDSGNITSGSDIVPVDIDLTGVLRLKVVLDTSNIVSLTDAVLY